MIVMALVQKHVHLDLAHERQRRVTQAAVLAVLSMCQLMLFACHLVPAKCNQS